MKVKQDFVTNSSSTSFILKSEVHGLITGLDGSINELLKNVAEIYENYENSEVTYGRENNFEYNKDQYGSVTIKRNSELYDDYDWADIELSLDRCYKINGMNIDLVLKSGYLRNKNDDYCYYKSLYVLKNLCSNIGNDMEFDLTYFQYPMRLIGDEWNTGDPLEDYQYTWQCYRNETKVGNIKRSKNGRFYLSLKR